MKGVNMAQTASEMQTSPEPKNQNPNTDTYIPLQRETTIGSTALQLFSKETDKKSLEKTQEYIEDQLKDTESLKLGVLLIGILEKMSIIPTEHAAEDAPTREHALHIVEQLLIDIDTYTDESNKFNMSRFSTDVIDKVGYEELTAYPIIQLLQTAQSNARSTKNESKETAIVYIQRVVMLGIAVQLSK